MFYFKPMKSRLGGKHSTNIYEINGHVFNHKEKSELQRPCGFGWKQSSQLQL